MVNITNGHEPASPGTTDRRDRDAAGHQRTTARYATGVPDTALSLSGRAATATRYLLAGIRLALGWIFLWAFLDKLFGLGHSTVAAKSWLSGGSPTAGFLGKAAAGPFTGFYHAIAGHLIYAAVLVVLALLGAGTTLGLGRRWAATPLVRRNTWLT